MATPGASLSHHARLEHILIQDAQGDMKSLHGPSSTAVRRRSTQKLSISLLLLPHRACTFCPERMTVWWLPIPATWLPKTIEEPLTEPCHRRSILRRRSSDGGCCLFRTPLPVIPRAGTRTAPSLLRRIFSESFIVRTRTFQNRVLMVTVNRRGFFPFLAPILVPTVCPVLAPNPIRADRTPSLSANYRTYRRRSSLTLQ
jgi:hypothetical protein